MMIFFYNNRFAIDLGYSSFTDGALNMQSVVFSAVLQLIIEMFFDVISAQVEHTQGLPPSDFFFQLRNAEIFIMHISGYVGAITWILIPMKTIPSLLYCTTPNPCSCDSFYVYRQLCESIKYSNSTSSFIDDSSETISLTTGSGPVVLLSVLGTIGICALAYAFINSWRSYHKVQNIYTTLEKEKKMNKAMADVASNGLKQLSALQQALSTIEALSRGASPAQTKLLQSIIEILKVPNKITNVDIDKVLMTSSTDADVVNYLKSQLMNQEEFQLSRQQVKAVTVGNKGTGRRASVQSAPLHVKGFHSNLEPLILTSGQTHNLEAPEAYDPAAYVPYHDLKPHDSNEFTNLTSWDFNIFGLNCKTPLTSLAWECFKISNIIGELKLPSYPLHNILLHVEENYSMSDYEGNTGYGSSFSGKALGVNNRMQVNEEGRSKTNTYHNNLHGADVMQAVLFFALNHKAIGEGLTSLDFFSLLFAACIHDANHPGLNTTFVVNDWPASCITAAFGTEVSSYM